MNKIELKEPIVIPATPKKTFPLQRIRVLSVTDREMDSTSMAVIELVPYNSETKESLHTQPEVIRVPLWKLMEASPEARAAMEAVFAAIPAIRAFAEALKPKPAAK